ncbi:hypothetical protein ONA70_28205 [Micromonospora yasonensis]|uniref:hypothetical protein n=1 Tax=Micromonospora yasonensis TaxID=1128667 RepID=UPI00222E42A8|nr:hypothetical protein [Micromonospora yasonensis]MCW3843979.1 hypothetical protein [Micromonospora yasonensis]
MTVIHHPRVAWDAARVIVESVHDEQLFSWVRQELGGLLGSAAQAALTETRDRLRRDGDARVPVEAGLWRVRLEDLLRDRPELAGQVSSFTAVAIGLLRARGA